MTQQHLITFGDSWPEGAELDLPREQTFGAILATKHGFDRFTNYGQSGTSVENMLYQLQDYLAKDHQPSAHVTAIFFLTNPGRTEQWPNLPMHVTNADEMYKQAMIHFFSDKNQKLRINASVSALQLWCRNYNISDWYFAGWNRYENWMLGIDQAKIYKQGQETAADWFGATKHNGDHLLDVGDNVYIRPNFCHPNQLGHQLIADKLWDWIGPSR